jgi:predicted small metal-binding protein
MASLSRYTPVVGSVSGDAFAILPPALESLHCLRRTSGTWFAPPSHSGKGGDDLARGFDCSHSAHEDIHFSAENDDELFRKVQEHRDQYHSEISDDQLRQLVSSGAYDE